MRILVTGGCGFIGSAFVRQAEAAGHSVSVLDKFTYAARADNLGATRCSVYRVDVADADRVHGIFKVARPDAVVHFAAESHVEASFLSRRLFIRSNVLGTDTVFEAAQLYGVEKAIHISTDEVFGSLPHPGMRMTEDAQLAPRNPYAASKASAEMVVSAFRETYKYPIMMARFSNCFGPRQHWEKLIPLTISRIIAGEPAIVHSDGLQTREWLPVERAALGVMLMLEKGKPGTTYNFPGPVEMPVISIVSLIADALRRYNPTIIKLGDRTGGTDRHYGMNGSRAREGLGWSCDDVSVPAELIRTIAWYMMNPSWLQPKKSEAQPAAVSAI